VVAAEGAICIVTHSRCVCRSALGALTGYAIQRSKRGGAPPAG